MGAADDPVDLDVTQVDERKHKAQPSEAHARDQSRSLTAPRGQLLVLLAGNEVWIRIHLTGTIALEDKNQVTLGQTLPEIGDLVGLGECDPMHGRGRAGSDATGYAIATGTPSELQTEVVWSSSDFAPISCDASDPAPAGGGPFVIVGVGGGKAQVAYNGRLAAVGRDAIVALTLGGTAAASWRCRWRWLR